MTWRWGTGTIVGIAQDYRMVQSERTQEYLSIDDVRSGCPVADEE
ncbi:hypothetical protein [Xylella fastidiosa]|nr:hypothetical protein [Xylella fastidiosa]MDG4871426.1 hypothetical protein [Xylella fastidiosa subsp. multiplex]WNY18220.1 hypothetical protein RO839_06795 [Xylella fastidiosa]WNY20509.1 hypothetical protein RO838_06815 [Xylella fastidiosa]